MRSRLLDLLAVAACAGAAGCGMADSPSPAEDPAPERWTVAPEPTLRLGAVEGESAHVFGRVAGAARLSDGRVAVLDAEADQLRLFDASGRHITTHGGEGEGPGEFRSASWVGRSAGDTLHVWDGQLRRLSTLHPSGGYVGSRRLELPGGMYAVRAVGLTDDGTIAFTGRVLPRPGGTPDSLVILSVTRDDRVTTVQRGHEADLISIGREGEPRMILPRPFGRRWHAAAGSGGIVYGYNDRYTLQVHGGGEIGRAHEPRKVTRELVEQLRDHIVSNASEGMRDSWDRSFEEEPLPTVPAFYGLEVDDRRRIWARRYEWPWLPIATWDVFTPEGALLAEVEVPTDLDIYQIGEDFLLAKAQDELGVDYVVLHELRKSDTATRSGDGGA